MRTPTLPPGVAASTVGLRAVLFVLPCAALALALPEVPHPAVVVLVVGCSAWWARTPEHPTGAVALVLVVGWWTVHGVVDWRVLVVGVLLTAAHVVATVLSYGPATLVVDRRVAALWVRRWLLALVPMPITYVAVRGLDADLAPPWAWTVVGLSTVALMVVTSRLTRPESL